MTGRMQSAIAERSQRDWVRVTGTVLIVIGLTAGRGSFVESRRSALDIVEVS